MGVIAVTGGAGFIGRHLVRLLAENGARLRVVERSGVTVDVGATPGVDVRFADIRDPSAVKRALAGAEFVYHLAANPQLWTRRKADFAAVNFHGAVNVIRAALEVGAKKVLHTSTESILTLAEQDGPIREEQTVSINDVIGPYCRSKYRAERFALRLGQGGAPVVVVNPTLPVGPGDWNRSPPTQMMLDFCLGKRSAYLDAELNMIDVRDVALGMMSAMRVGQPGRRYLLGAEDWSVKRAFDRLAELTGLPRPSWRVPYAVALGAAYASELIADLFTGRVPAATVTGVKLTRRRMSFDASRSLAELRLRPRPVSESIREAVDWFREVGWLRARA